MFIRPAREGLIVRDPLTLQPLPSDGADVPPSSYWRRRLAAGDVVAARPVQPTKPAASKTAASPSAKED